MTEQDFNERLENVKRTLYALNINLSWKNEDGGTIMTIKSPPHPLIRHNGSSLSQVYEHTLLEGETQKRLTHAYAVIERSVDLIGKLFVYGREGSIITYEGKETV